MILVEIREGDAGPSISVHSGLTVVQGLDAESRRRWAADLVDAFRGQATAMTIYVELGGSRQRLSQELVTTLALVDAAGSITVHAAELPGAKPAAVIPTPDRSAADAEALASLEQLRKEVDAAQSAAAAADDEAMALRRGHAGDHVGALAEAERSQTGARVAADEARRSLSMAEEAAAKVADELAAKNAEIAGFDRERDELVAVRDELVARMLDLGDPGEPEAVTAALAALRRLRSVKAKPSVQAAELANRWAALNAELAALPQPPQPPEWLVTPALAALEEARGLLAVAESAVVPVVAEPTALEALERAHREVIEAEQRAMKKGSRVNRRRLDTAHDAETTALNALGLANYGEYLRRTVPEKDGGARIRVDKARVAVADAEAVWEELHGGQASPEWTAAKERQANLRKEAFAVLGREVDDAQLESELRNFEESVVESTWAETELATALQRGGAEVDDDADLEQVAERWLAESPAWRAMRRELEAELSQIEERLAAAAQRRFEALGDEPTEEPYVDAHDPDKTDPDETDPDAPDLESVRQAAAVTTAAEREADENVEDARRRLAASERGKTELEALVAEVAARRREVDDLVGQTTQAEAAAAVAAMAPTEPDPLSTGAPGVDLSAVVGMEAEAYLLARVAALRGASGGPLPLVVDVETLSGLGEGARRRVLRLCGRLAGSMQVVVLGDDDTIATWAQGLGDRAAVRAVAR